MKCRQVIERLADYRHERLPALESAAVQQHLLACAHCQRQHELEQFGRALLVATREAGEPSAYFLTRVKARLAEVRREAESKRDALLWWEVLRQLTPAVFAMVLLILALTFFPHLTDTGPTPGIDDMAMHNAPGDERLLFSNEELSRERVRETVLSTGR